MLVRLLPDQIARNWDIIKYAVEEAMPPTIIGTPDKINNLFESLLIGKMVCWASVKADYSIEGILITTILKDGISGQRSLMVFCVYSYTNESTDMSWKSGLQKLMKVAESLKCDQIVGYTTNENICSFVERVGGDASQRFVTIPLYQNGTQEE